ncbi:MAG: AMIN domain-containing protein, partial [Deltaproteobacteria bacterium]|nr:AMIN domain-containing protein [Deltaproteobacteria bacterium]
GKVVLRNVIGDKELYGTTIDNIPAGSHKILVKAVYSGSGYGIFDYHQNYKYPLKSETEVKVRDGRVTSLKIIFNDNDGFLAELEKRPFISYETGQTAVTVSEAEKYIREKEKKIDDGKAKVKAGHIEKVLVEKGVHEVKVNVVGDGFFEEISTSRIDKPERIVIDIAGVKELLDIDKVVVKSPLLDRVRVGQHPHMSRVVLDIPHKKKVDYNVEKISRGLIVSVFDDRPKDKEPVKSDLKGKHSWNLTDVYVEKKDKRVEILYAGMGKRGAYEGKRFEKPDRIVVDIKAARESIRTNTINVNSSLLNSVRIGQHPGGLRLVMDVPEKIDAAYEIREVKKGLLVIISENKKSVALPVKMKKTESPVGQLKEISVEKGSVEVEIAIKGKGPFSKYDVKKLGKPDRIVVDLPGIKEDLKTDEIDVDSSVVKKIRVHYEAGVTRIVIDLEEGINMDYDLVPVKGGLVISVFKKD